MTQVTLKRLFAAVEATWPAARVIRQGRFALRDGQGGGKRVSAATGEAPFSVSDIKVAEAGMADLGQPPLFMVREGETELDAALQTRGYGIVDPVVVLTMPISKLVGEPIPRLVTFVIWEPLAIMAEIWAQGGIGPGRLEVMRRAAVKTAIFARWNQKPAGTGFVAVDRDVAMVHAVEVLPEHRRQGVAGWIMRQAALWAAQQGAETMAVLCTKENKAALGLYSGLGFEPAAEYHYRLRPNAGD